MSLPKWRGLWKIARAVEARTLRGGVFVAEKGLIEGVDVGVGFLDVLAKVLIAAVHRTPESDAERPLTS